LIARKLTFSALHCDVGLKRRPDVNGQFAQGFSGKSLFSFWRHRPIIGEDPIPGNKEGSTPMSWTTPTLVEVCIGLEINGYLPPEF
jgi:coenzyme PQQ precursor peptide PqqA